MKKLRIHSLRHTFTTDRYEISLKNECFFGEKKTKAQSWKALRKLYRGYHGMSDGTKIILHEKCLMNTKNVKSLLVLQNFTVARKSGNILLAY